MTIFTARVPVALACPEPMRDAIAHVLDGEYETGHDGRGLSILDIGANVGSFAIWSMLRWPDSTVTSFEPHPGTFAMLSANTAGRPGITAVNAALFPGEQRKATFLSRFAGDGESGLAAYAGDTFAPGAMGESYEVDVVDPASLPSADVVKIDIEGGEGAVVGALDLSRTELFLAEFQNRKNRAEIRAALGGAFDVFHDEEHAWDALLGYSGYRADLKGDVWGRLFAVRKGATRLTKAAAR
jgi:FkbM family methyltransferase